MVDEDPDGPNTNDYGSGVNKLCRRVARRTEKETTHVRCVNKVPTPSQDCPFAIVRRPCPMLNCRYHLWTERAISVSLVTKTPIETALREIAKQHAPSCALDLAEQGPQLLRQVAEVFGVFKQRVSQLTAIALAKLADDPDAADMLEQLKDLASYQDRMDVLRKQRPALRPRSCDGEPR